MLALTAIQFVLGTHLRHSMTLGILHFKSFHLVVKENVIHLGGYFKFILAEIY